MCLLDGPVRESNFYISLDWVLLDLIIIATLFINLELFFRLKKNQVILRSGWQVDLTHYVANHIFNGGLVYLMFLPSQILERQFAPEAIQNFLSSQILVVQVFLIMLVTDFVQYWVHRAFHRVSAVMAISSGPPFGRENGLAGWLKAALRGHPAHSFNQPRAHGGIRLFNRGNQSLLANIGAAIGVHTLQSAI